MSIFKKKTLEDEIKSGNRQNRQTQREFERDRKQLDRDENQLVAEIKKLAQQGNKEACGVLAKQLIRIRQQRTRSYEMGAKMNGIAAQQSLMGSNLKMTTAMKNTAKTLDTVNKQMDPATTAKIMGEFSKQNMKMTISEDVMNDALSDLFDNEEGEEDAVVQQVLDEIGVEVSGRMAKAPIPSAGSLAAASSSKVPTDEELEAQLDKLRSL